jgi:hypothetical protein
MDSDISPDGYRSPAFWGAKSDHQLAVERQREETLSQIPLLKEVVKRMDGRIAATDSVKQVLVVAKQYEIDRETALVVLDLVRQQLEVERGFIQTRIDKASR